MEEETTWKKELDGGRNYIGKRTIQKEDYTKKREQKKDKKQKRYGQKRTIYQKRKIQQKDIIYYFKKRNTEIKGFIERKKINKEEVI